VGDTQMLRSLPNVFRNSLRAIMALPATFKGICTRRLLHQSRHPVRTVREVLIALAALGGHLGRTWDVPPGWQILLLGRRSLRRLVEEVRLAAQLPPE